MLEDGDTVILRAWGEREGFVRIGLGECRGTVLPARVASARRPHQSTDDEVTSNR